jgi:hypothetical protein
VDPAEVHNHKESFMRRIMMTTAAAAIALGGLLGAAGVASAEPAAVASPSQDGPLGCLQNVLEHDYEGSVAVLQGCTIANTGAPEDVQKCEFILQEDGVAADVARESCRLASAED